MSTARPLHITCRHATSFALTLLLCSVAFIQSAIAQSPDTIYITPNATAQAIARNLAGQGITISNAKLNCPQDASGIFVTQNSNLGMDSGVILTTGRAATVVVHVGTMDILFPGANGNRGYFGNKEHFAPGNLQLSNYVNKATHDACELEFDFVPQGDTMRFDYIFGSEEYRDYSCSNFNDAFAFFISGPGITGVKNLAMIPNTNIPVSINSTTDVGINKPVDITNCNNMGAGSPFSQYYKDNNPGQSVSYEGFTSVLTAVSHVLPCSTYHLKLVIADGSDGKLDSGVWLKSNSLSSNLPKVIPLSSTGSFNDVPAAIRGCKPAQFIFTRSSASPSPLIVRYNISGTAINGVDYKKIADSVIIPAFSKTVKVSIEGIVNGTKGMKKVVVHLFSPYDCAGTNLPIDSAEIEIWDELKLQLNTTDTAICAGASIYTSGKGEQDYTYSWTPTNGVLNTSTINTVIKPDSSRKYKLTASYPGCKDVSRYVAIDVQPVPKVSIGNDIEICQYEMVAITANTVPAWYPNYYYTWTGAGVINRSIKNGAIVGTEHTTVTVRVQTPIGCYGVDSIKVKVNPGDFAYIKNDTLGLCPNDTLHIDIAGGISYGWSPNEYISKVEGPSVDVYPIAGMLYNVLVINDKGCKDTLHVPVEMYSGAVLHLGDDKTLYPGQYYQMNPQGNCEFIDWFPEVGLDNPHSNNPIAKPDVYTRYFAHGTTIHGCKTTDTIDIYLKETVVDVPNAFTPSGLYNKELKIIKRGIATLKYFRIFNRWGEVVFETTSIDKGWDGKFNGVEQPLGVYVYMVEAVTNDGRPFVQKGNITLLR